MSTSKRTSTLATAMILGACLAPACGGSGSTSFSPSTTGGAGGSVSSGGSSASGGLSTGSGGTQSGGSSAIAGSAGNAGSSTMGASGSAGSNAGGGMSGSTGSAGSGAGGMSGMSGMSGTSAGGAGGGAAGSAGSSGLCVADNTPCASVSGNGICEGQLCTDCADDPSCVTAYGAGNLCISGSCQPGDCRVNADCASNTNGSICGATQANTCGKCSADSQCSAGNICDTASGKCVANTCSTGTGNACTQNASDVCCAGACFTGACCADAACKATLGPTAVCTNHTCTTCDTVTGANPVYLVDPAAGDDGSATGKGTSGGGTLDRTCRFATITRALQAIGPSPAAGTVIQIVGPATVPDATNKKAIAEAFPIAIPSHVTITAATGAVVVNPPAGSVAFSLSAPASGIDGALGGGGTLTLEGATHVALTGVADGTGSTDGTFLRNVVIQNFSAEGVTVSGAGVLGIQQGVSVLSNGFGAPKRSGLLISGTAHANINVAAGAATTSFNKNAQHGILVSGSGWVFLKGTVTAGSGTVECRQNAASGLAIAQTPGTPPLSTINGLLVAGTTAGNGIRLEGGSNVTLQNSTSLGNAASGVLVTTSLVGLTRNNDLSKIILGNGGTAGLNKLQADAGNAPNQGAGICLQMDTKAGTLLAEGNMFSAGTNCSQAAAVLTFSNTVCAGGRDLGITPAIALASVVGNDIKVDQCSHP